MMNETGGDLRELDGTSGAFIEELYERFLNRPDSVDRSWHQFFTSLGPVPATDRFRPSWARSDWPPALAEKEPAVALAPAAPDIARSDVVDSVRAIMLIRAYRVRGHLIADLDPLHLSDEPWHTELDPASYGFAEEDMDRPIFLDYMLGVEHATMREIMEILHRNYCSTIGVEFMHISNGDEKSWIQNRMEGREKEASFTSEGKKAILQKIIESEAFEHFLAAKYTGTKRFGLEGAESLTPALEAIIKRGGQLGIEEIVIGMPHRGRLNILANVMAKPLRAMFHEFHGGASKPEEIQGSGDVKYHLGSSSDREFDGLPVHLSLSPNPSHLEAVDPVVLGKARAKQQETGDRQRSNVLPLLIHGDAAFAGQGLVAECFAMSALQGHSVGGTIHIIINNQIGFTTSPIYSRSSPYPSDVAKTVQAPIFHVNGDDPEALVHVCKVATEFRQNFKKDVVIDMFCYRRQGHNESDEPGFTQPLMYRKIKDHPLISKTYTEKLIEEGEIDQSDADKFLSDYQTILEQEFEGSENYRPNKADWLDGRWAGLHVARGDVRRGDTGVRREKLKEVGHALCTLPATFSPHRTIRRLLAAKLEMIDNETGIDWPTAEALAFGTLIQEGFSVRLSGQDSSRGTFSQRHSVLVDQETEERYAPLSALSEDEGAGNYEVIDSLLSEAAVLGFEYGYSTAEPNTLVLWEAQFGDFANGAQVIVDQFVAAAESKWLRMSGLVMLLPHGYEGQGPEHSSARLERYLQLCAEDNFQVVNCTTPANYFHVLRRQMHRDFRKPLVVMTPKSLLRHRHVRSDMKDFRRQSSFHRVLWDMAEVDPASAIKLKPDAEISRVILCSGKVYYDLYERREEAGIRDIQIIRLEQLYPFPARALGEELGRFPKAEVIWCQEEPGNMGAWTFVEPAIEDVLVRMGAEHTRPRYVGRPPAAATATGQMKAHLREQAVLLDEALDIGMAGI